MTDNTVIEFKKVLKVFHRDSQHDQIALLFLKRIFGRICGYKNRSVEHTRVVLKDINLKINKGEKVGIVGRNGTGKSTLLRLIASIYEPNEGLITVRGSVAYISGFSQGIRPRLSAIDNIKVLGALYGVPISIVESMRPHIIDFAELGDFEEDKIFTYSDGMRSRLAFSACMHFIEYNNPDIILLDEVFSGGGDASFQEKAKARLTLFLKDDKTVIFVSHTTDQIKSFCSRVVMLKDQTVIKDGANEEVLAFYKEHI